MPVTDTRMVSYASLDVYDAGEGDPVVSDWGTWRLDVLEHSSKFGVFSQDGNGNDILEVIPKIGLVCRAFYAEQNTRSADWAASGGAWEEVLPAVAPQVYYLRQYSSAADTTWSATSNFFLPAEPSFAFAFLPNETPGDHDSTTYPPYWRLEFGGLWGIEFSRAQGTRLLKSSGGTLLEYAKLPEPQEQAAASLGQRVMFVRYQRGRLLFSGDFGRTWEVVAEPDGTPCFVPMAKLTIRGQGVSLAFGLHQLVYYGGAYNSMLWRTHKSRNVTASPATVTTPGAQVDHGSVVAVADVMAGTVDVAQYACTITPGTLGWQPFTFYYSPAVPLVYLKYPPVTAAGSGAVTKPWDSMFTAVNVRKPVELGEADASLTVRQDPDTAFTGEYRFRKAKLTLGFYLENGTLDSDVVLTGYISSVRPQQPSFRRSPLQIEIAGGAVRAKQVRWNRVQGTPLLGNQSLNAALDECLTYIGLSTGDRDWNSHGTMALPMGLADEPMEWAREGEPVWETMARIAAYGAMDIGYSDAGLYYTALKGATNATTYTLEANPAADGTARIEDAALVLEYMDSYTAVVITGVDAMGGEVSAFIADGTAEGDKTSGRFAPWRQLWQEGIPGTTSSGIATRMAQGYALEKLGPGRHDPEIVTCGRTDIARRDRVIAQGTKVGMGDAEQFRVEAITHRWVPGPARVQTTLGCRKVVE